MVTGAFAGQRIAGISSSCPLVYSGSEIPRSRLPVTGDVRGLGALRSVSAITMELHLDRAVP